MKGGRAQNTLGIKKYNKRKGIKDVSEGPPFAKKSCTKTFRHPLQAKKDKGERH